MIVLSVPLRRVHPGVKDGSLKQKLDELNELILKKNRQKKKIKKKKIKKKRILTRVGTN
jgi:hypothetical protein